jgi:hypothetical protein
LGCEGRDFEEENEEKTLTVGRLSLVGFSSKLSQEPSTVNGQRPTTDRQPVSSTIHGIFFELQG